MDDITIIATTANLVPEKWAAFHRMKLEEVIGDTPLISLSYKPMDWGTNLIQTEYSIPNLYKQLLRACKVATTKWIATADDDTLYPPGHYQFRGEKDGFYYNLNRWQLATWKPDLYFHKPKPGFGCMVATRELVISALENRLAKTPELDGYAGKELGTFLRHTRFDEPEHIPFYTGVGLVSFYHDYSHNSTRNKRIFPVRAYDIPHWRKAIDLSQNFI